MSLREEFARAAREGGGAAAAGGCGDDAPGHDELRASGRGQPGAQTR